MSSDGYFVYSNQHPERWVRKEYGEFASIEDALAFAQPLCTTVNTGWWCEISDRTLMAGDRWLGGTRNENFFIAKNIIFE
jgi:hypothetical protein